MKKFILFILILSTCLYSHEKGQEKRKIYLGIESEHGSGHSDFFQERDFEFDIQRLKIGVFLTSNLSFEFTYPINKNIDVNNSDISNAISFHHFNFKYRFNLKNNRYKPFIGVGFGHYDYETNEATTSQIERLFNSRIPNEENHIRFRDGLKYVGKSLSYKIGVYIYLNEKLFIELGVTNTQINWDSLNNSILLDSEYNSFFLGINYFL